MALFNEILVGRFARFAQKHFSMKGRAPTPTLSADVQMGMDFNTGAENRYLEGWDLFAGGASQAAIAAQFTLFSFRNPKASGVVAVITSAIFIDGAAATAVAPGVMKLSRGATTDQNTVLTPQAFDARGRLQASCNLTNNSAAPAGTGGTVTNVTFAAYAANGAYQYVPPGLEVPVLPGDAVLFQTAAINTASTFSMWWRERLLEESERT